MSDNTGESELDQRRAGALKGLEALNEPSEVRDVDPLDWLAASDGHMTGTVEVEGIRLKIAALTEGETQILMKASRRPDPRRPDQPAKLDTGAFRLGCIAFSLNKANPGKPPLTPNQLESKKTGVLTTIQEAIMELSGMSTAEQRPTAAFFD